MLAAAVVDAVELIAAAFAADGGLVVAAAAAAAVDVDVDGDGDGCAVAVVVVDGGDAVVEQQLLV